MYMQMIQVSARVSWPVPRRVWLPTHGCVLHPKHVEQKV
jgi:hypothetical protein